MKENTTPTPANVLTLRAWSNFRYDDNGYCDVRFTEDGWELLSDTRPIKVGYLHVDDASPASITPKLAEVLIQYFYHHDHDLPGLGATPQERYLADYPIAERERIAGVEHVYYNLAY